MIHTGYNPTLVTLSIAIAVFASYTALDLGGRVRGAAAGPRWAWATGAAVAMGGGIWSMHFIGMLALRMAMPVSYDIGLTMLSFVVAIAATGGAFAIVSRRGAHRSAVWVSGPMMGAGVAAMHYAGMAAMRMPGGIVFSPPVVAVSVLIAMTAATAALFLTFRQNEVWQKMLGACAMGVAVAGMHYTGMAAASFTAVGGEMGDMHSAMPSLSQQMLALYVAGATFAILILAMLAAAIDQQRTQRRLRASEARFRAAAEAVGDIIWTNSPEGRMLGPQPDWGAFTGQSEAEYEGFGWAKALHPEDVEASIAAWNAAVAERRIFIFEHRLRRHDGVYRNFSVRGVPVLDEAGAVREWVGVHADITERREFEAMLKAARDAAEEANVAKSTFIANMSHELRTPLSAIIGYSEMMLEEVEAEERHDLAADMRKVEANARHLLGLINDVLDLSKVESGKMEVFAEDFDIAATVRDVAATVDTLITRRNNQLDLRIAPKLGSMHSDVTRVRQMLLNLLSNAAKFTEGGIITLDVSRPADGIVRFRVSDTGIGMTPAQVGRLFQRFTQADSSTTRRFGGTGLGLSLTKACADLLGGEVAVDSLEGQGTTFTITLPERFAARGNEVDDVPAASADEHVGDDLVLVIDDDADQRALMTRFLAREGFRSRTAGDGETGLRLARELKPRAILLDVMMPGVDGWSVLSALKSDADLRDIPVIMVTFIEQRALAASLGATDYVMKPVRWERFKAVMDRFRPPEDVVLVVDDDADTRQRVRSMLERDGWSVAEAENGREALDRLSAARPGIVLLDLMMPVMDGFAFLEAMRARPDCAAIPVVVLTAMDLTREDRRRLVGVSQVLNKGDINLRTLGDRLHRAAESAAAVPLRHSTASAHATAAE